MLKLVDIVKEYEAGGSAVRALDGVSVTFRKSEFVSVLGPSGCGKTTLLNIIGGLDHYTTGDLVIAGRSTKEYRDADWDTYRNHSVGFVFQSYNLIPHQSVLANVELALTLSGVSKAERKRRAAQALRSVGLEDQMGKRPNQLSGGQMQRVAIARALVNDPEILLADEPTGALDSATSVQIMELLKEIAKDRLVIMVTHNPELAKDYSTRIIKLLDGRITDDSMPLSEEDAEAPQNAVKKKKSMSFFTALSLSLNNLMTKKGRTVMVSLAGSIGIIGIALILSVSTGVQRYIDRVQEDTLSSYPLSIEAETVDMGSLVTTLMTRNSGVEKEEREEGRVYTSAVLYDLMNAANSLETNKNNLTRFKKYIEENADFRKYTSAVQYDYDVTMDVYVTDPDGAVVKADPGTLMEKVYGGMGVNVGGMGGSSMFSRYYGGIEVWDQMLAGADGALVSPLVTEQYELLAGHFPSDAHEVVLIVNERNEISDMTLYSLGLRSAAEITERIRAAMENGSADTSDLGSWGYDELCGLEFKIILPTDRYKKQGGVYVDLAATDTGLSLLYGSDAAVPVTIGGIIRPKADATSAMLSGTIGYTTALTDELIARIGESGIIREQQAHPDVDVINGLPFAKEDDEGPVNAEKAEAIRAYLEGLSDAELAAVYTDKSSRPSDEYLAAAVSARTASLTRKDVEEQMIASYAGEMGVTDTAEIEKYVAAMTDEEIMSFAENAIAEQVKRAYAAEVEKSLASVPASTSAAMFRTELAAADEAALAALYDAYMPATVSDRDYDAVMEALGYVDPEKPASINLYAATFADKDKISDLIAAYNAALTAEEEDDKIEYTDYIALLMSSISTVISAISYVLIAFVAISLIVSSIMIGIITHISVLERTKEIGILRAIGASKRDVSRVFNAETLIIGFSAGLMGIVLTLLLILPINLLLHLLTGIASLGAVLPVRGAIVLVAISMLLTLVAGIIPARGASKKDPVIALRTE